MIRDDVKRRKWARIYKMTRDYNVHFDWLLERLDRLQQEFTEEESYEYMTRYLEGTLVKDIF